MPYYEFKCSNEECGEVYDDLVKMDTKEVNCKECGSPAHKTMGSFKSVALGLPNGFHSIRTPKK